LRFRKKKFFNHTDRMIVDTFLSTIWTEYLTSLSRPQSQIIFVGRIVCFLKEQSASFDSRSTVDKYQTWLGSSDLIFDFH